MDTIQFPYWRERSRFRAETCLDQQTPGGGMEMKQALLIIDMLNDFVRENAPLEVPKAREIIPSLQRHLAAARKQGLEVVFICDSHAPDDPEFKVWPPHAVQGTAGARVVAELSPREGEGIIGKSTLLGFYDTELENFLVSRQVEELILTGCVTNICVYFIAVEAAVRGFRVRVFADAVASLDDREGEFALLQMENILGVKVER